MIFVRPAQAQGTDRDMYAAALAREGAVRATFSDAGVPAEATLDEVRSVVNAYVHVPTRFPASGYSDNALWQAGRLLLDAFARFGEERDKKAGVRLLQRLATAYPTSKMAKRVPAAIEAIGPFAGPVDPETAPTGRERPPPPAARRATPAAKVSSTGPTATVRSIKRTVLPDAVRIVIELDTEVMFHEERIASPDRLFLDLTPARAAPALRNQTLRFEGDADVVRQVRLGSHENRTTCVVLDAGGVATYSVYAIYNPYRLVVDCVRGNAAEPVRAVLTARVPVPLDAKMLAPPWTRRLPSLAPHGAGTIREAMAIVPVKSPVTPLVVAAPPPAPKPIAADESRPTIGRLTPPAVVSQPPLLALRPLAPAWSRRLPPTTPRSTAAIDAAVASLPPPAPASPLGPGTIAPEKLPGTTTSSTSTFTFGAASPPAKNSNGGFSIARQLGLGVSRIVIDPGHGGHDPGAMGKDVSKPSSCSTSRCASRSCWRSFPAWKSSSLDAPTTSFRFRNARQSRTARAPTCSCPSTPTPARAARPEASKPTS